MAGKVAKLTVILLAAILVASTVGYWILAPEISPVQISTNGPASSTATGERSKCLQMTTGDMVCSIIPTDDTFVDNMFATEPMENAAPLLLIVQDTPSDPVSSNYAFLKFDLSAVIPKAIFASHALPTNAILWLYAGYLNGFSNASVRVYHVLSNDWDENTLTWGNMPPVDTTHSTPNQIHAVNRWYMWKVTADVANDIQGNGTSSFALIPGSASWMNYAWFTSKENVTYTPELDVYFRESTLTTPSSSKIEEVKMGPIAFNHIGHVYHGIGDLHSSFGYMNKALETHTLNPSTLMYSPLFAKARGDPRYPELGETVWPNEVAVIR